MITLNTEKGLVRIESWDDVLSRPGFTTDIDPNEVELKNIIGRYQFKEHVTCGLLNCHQPHGRGYLVVTVDGRETNIGNICGKKHFSVDFENMRKTFDRDFKSKERRENITRFKNQLQSYNDQVDNLRNGLGGATWIYERTQPLKDRSKGLPESVLNVIKNLVKAGGHDLVKERDATKEELEILKEAGNSNRIITEKVGTLEGIEALYSENNLRTVLVHSVIDVIKKAQVSEVDQLNEKELATLSKKVSEVDRNIKLSEKEIQP